MNNELLLMLRFYATGSFYITIGDFGGLHSSTLCKIIKRLTEEAIASMRKNFVHLPGTREEILSIQEKVYNIARIPRVIAALVGTRIKIISPGSNTAENSRNRKKFFSLNVQAMCTSVKIVTQWTGSTHDSMIFSNLSAKYYCDNGAFGNGIILGVIGYF